MRLSQAETSSVKGPSVEQLVADLRQMAELLEASLHAVLERSPTKDPSALDYPMLARDFGKRLANINNTIAVLETASLRQNEAA
jgi:hypothetical protein